MALSTSPDPDPTPPGNAARAALLRLLDANANRATEGLRVVEDYARFVREDKALVAHLKQLRHVLVAALAEIPWSERLAARDTSHDVGVDVAADDEYVRADLPSVAIANWKRVQQAVRSLEEYSKLAWPAAAARLESLRYELYTLERTAGLATSAATPLATARLYVLVDGGRDAGEFACRLDRLLEAPVPLIQLRAKTLTDRELLDRAYLARRRTRDAGTLLIINDRPDIAALVDADGVHVGQEELPVNAARRILGSGKLVGVSTHNHQQLLDALRDGADYVGCGPAYPSATKEFQEFTGLEFLSQVAQATDLPAFAIGGMTLERLDEVLATGLHRVAVQSAIWNAPDPAKVARAFLARLAMH